MRVGTFNVATSNARLSWRAAPRWVVAEAQRHDPRHVLVLQDAFASDADWTAPLRQRIDALKANDWTVELLGRTPKRAPDAATPNRPAAVAVHRSAFEHVLDAPPPTPDEMTQWQAHGGDIDALLSSIATQEAALATAHAAAS